MTKGKRESLRYLENAKELLMKSPIEDDTYTDITCMQEGCATAYLAILKAIKDHHLPRNCFPGQLLFSSCPSSFSESDSGDLQWDIQ